MPSKYSWLLWIAGTTFLVDQLTKSLVLRFFALGESAEVLGHIKIWHARNAVATVVPLLQVDPQYRRILLVIVPVLIVGALLMVVRNVREQHHAFTVALSLLIGGALGNVADRLFRRFVTDFILIEVGAFRSPAFNVGDVATVAGAALLTMAALVHLHGQLARTRMSDG